MVKIYKGLNCQDRLRRTCRRMSHSFRNGYDDQAHRMEAHVLNNQHFLIQKQ